MLYCDVTWNFELHVADGTHSTVNRYKLYARRNSSETFARIWPLTLANGASDVTVVWGSVTLAQTWCSVGWKSSWRLPCSHVTVITRVNFVCSHGQIVKVYSVDITSRVRQNYKWQLTPPPPPPPWNHNEITVTVIDQNHILNGWRVSSSASLFACIKHSERRLKYM
jgi:hypothetical protein